MDFLILNPDGSLALYQACLDLSHEETRLREFTALTKAAKELQLSRGHVITWDHEETVQTEGITIECIPFWKWAS